MLGVLQERHHVRAKMNCVSRLLYIACLSAEADRAQIAQKHK